MNAFSIVSNERELTSPDPVPPLIVFLIPLPYKYICFSLLLSGKSPFFLNKTVHSEVYSFSLFILFIS